MRGRSPSLPASRPPAGSKSGQALLESFGIILLLCMILFGMVQYVLMLTATEVVQYSADASVRARAVGFNEFMVRKVSMVTAIPNAGVLSSGNIDLTRLADWEEAHSAGTAYNRAISSNPGSSQYWQIERFNIPLVLGSPTFGQVFGYLNYDDWDTVAPPLYTSGSNNMIGVVIRQDYPLRMPFLRAFSEDDEIQIRKEANLADHAELYLE